MSEAEVRARVLGGLALFVLAVLWAVFVQYALFLMMFFLLPPLVAYLICYAPSAVLAWFGVKQFVAVARRPDGNVNG